jgi:hypothetical protein
MMPARAQYGQSMSSGDLTQRLDAAWAARWAETPPIAHLLRSLHPELWVRCHSLPESKRYAESDAEYATVLRRHHSVLDELAASGDCFVIAAGFGSEDLSAGRLSLLPAATYWRTVTEPDDPEPEPVVAQLYVSLMRYPSSELDDVLISAADWQLAWTIVAPPDLHWLYHPYDGGADVIAPSSLERDRLKGKFARWLSKHPAGL